MTMWLLSRVLTICGNVLQQSMKQSLISCCSPETPCSTDLADGVCAPAPVTVATWWRRCILIPGNRDDKTSLRSNFSELDYLHQDDDFLHYVIDAAELRFIGLDSTDYGERKGIFCEQRQEWLQHVLADQPDRPTVLFIHHPPFDVGDHYINGYRHAEHAAALSNIVGAHHQVVALLCGHVHWPIEEVWAGTQARIMPSVAVDVREGVDESETGGNPVYYLHTVDRGRIKSQAVCADISVPNKMGAG